jgi:RNA polymerase sigma factor (sigma-70 family)
MAAALDKAIRQLRRVALTQHGERLSDGELLRRFVHDRDEAAFEVLLRRHGSLVLGVCRRVLHDPHDAEDAFQATFLVLVRRAGAIRKPSSLASWLHGVAHRTACHARRAAARRRAKEAEAMPPRELLPDGSAELAEVLDRELAGLPQAYREALVLCDLEGKTRSQAAQVLGCAEGTVASRVARGRALLAERLARRGFAVSGGAVAVLLSEAASACVPSSVVAATIKAATLVAAGQAAASAQVAALVEGVLKAMLLNKLKVLAAVLLAVGLLATATGLLATATGLRPVPAAAGDEGGAKASRPAAQGQVPVSDADFIRRASLDIRGTLPSAIEVHYFLRDTNADKRAWLLGKGFGRKKVTRTISLGVGYPRTTSPAPAIARFASPVPSSPGGSSKPLSYTTW